MNHLPHLALPFRLTRNGNAATIEQDSPADVVQCARVVLDTRPGERQVAATFGLADPTFGDLDVVEDVTAAVQEWDDRATVHDVTTAIDGLGDAQVRVEVS